MSSVEESAGSPDTTRPTSGGAGGDVLLTGPECAERIGVTAAGWRSLKRGGYVPPADVPDDDDKPVNLRRPMWRASTIDAWRASRPGTGNYARRHVVPFSGELR